MAKYTPGPWGLDSDGNVRSSHTKARDYASEHIATLDHYRDERLSERAPNAKLIAAAPDLLEACLNILPLLQNNVENGADLVPEMEVMEAAIAKAQGAA